MADSFRVPRESRSRSGSIGEGYEPVRGTRPVLRAADLPALLARDDGRGRIVALREFVKRWACDPEQRPVMIAQAPKRYRFYDRFTARRWDLARMAAVVHALCDRDAVPVPGWVWRHRCRHPIGVVASLDPNSKWGRAILADAPDACAYHDVWFDQTMIENISVHGFRD